jgi:hypothetical protein
MLVDRLNRSFELAIEQARLEPALVDARIRESDVATQNYVQMKNTDRQHRHEATEDHLSTLDKEMEMIRTRHALYDRPQPPKKARTWHAIQCEPSDVERG